LADQFPFAGVIYFPHQTHSGPRATETGLWVSGACRGIPLLGTR